MATPDASLRVHVGEPDPDHVVISLAGELDCVSSPEAEVEILAVLLSYRGRVSVDMAEITFVDLHGLSSLEVLHHTAHELGASLTVQNPSKVVRRLLELTGALDTFGLAT